MVSRRSKSKADLENDYLLRLETPWIPADKAKEF